MLDHAFNTEDESEKSWLHLSRGADDVQTLLAEITQCTKHGSTGVGAGDILRWRETYGEPLVKAGLELSKARAKARGKFPSEVVQKMLVDVSGVEQASSFDIALHKAERFEKTGVRDMFDLCCGIGGDTMGLARVLKEVNLVGVDVSAVRVMMARHNTQLVADRMIEGLVSDVTQLKLKQLSSGCEWGIHFDPARRGAGGRKHRYEDYLPGPEFIEHVMRHCANAMIKLGPGVGLELLPAGEVELISRDGVLVQTVLYGEGLSHATDQRTATMIRSGTGKTCGQVVSLRGVPSPLWDGAPVNAGDVLYTVDPSVERAELMGVLSEQLGLGGVHPRLGLLVGQSDPAVESVWVKGYRVLEVMSWREKKMKAALKAHDAGVVNVKTRGVNVNTDQMQARLRGSGERELVVFIQRLGKQQMAFITERLNG